MAMPGERRLRFVALAAGAIVIIAGVWLALGQRDASVGAGSPLLPASGNGAMASAGQPGAASHPPTTLSPTGPQDLMRRYRFEMALDKRGALLASLRSTPTEEVKQFALSLAGSSDPGARRDGLALLSAFPLSDADVRDFLVGQIRGEPDPEMLKTLVDMLAPTTVASEDAAPLVAELARLHHHPDPEVRAASVVQSTQWDKDGALEDTLQQALLDTDTRVRQAAIGGIASERVHSARLKDMLLAIALDPDTDDQERSAAVFALEGFSLTRSEVEIYHRAAELARNGGAGNDQP